MSAGLKLTGRSLAPGAAQGPLLFAQEGLSFWGGVDAATGEVADRHHPLRGQSLTGRVLAIPSGRGSCSGSGVLLELILNGRAPAAIVVCDAEEILTLGAWVGEELFGRALPVLRISREDFAHLPAFAFASVEGESLQVFEADPGARDLPPLQEPGRTPRTCRLEPRDQEMLEGRHGEATRMAMRLVLRMAALQGAERLIDVSQAHIDGCIYTGPATLRFAERLVDAGARVAVPTTLNAISVDRVRWRGQGVDPGFGQPAAALADAYVAMGARPTFTCAPYLLASAPAFGEQISWAESNAVVYANSVIGARTMKYPDFLDICIALTGRAPLAGCHLDEGRRATLAIDVARPEGADESFWPLLGHVCGALAGSDIPLLRGLEHAAPEPDDFKAFGAAFATTSAAPLFHIAGVTPEAASQAPSRSGAVGADDLLRAWLDLNTGDAARIGLVALGNPHFSLEEWRRLAGLLRGSRRGPDVELIVTSGPDVHAAAVSAGYVGVVEAFGGRCVTDACWCMLEEPIVPVAARTLMTNSAKYAHYAPGLVGRGVRFGSLAACADAARDGRTEAAAPSWLSKSSPVDMA